jgi:hypothetical protein
MGGLPAGWALEHRLLIFWGDFFPFLGGRRGGGSEKERGMREREKRETRERERPRTDT